LNDSSAEAFDFGGELTARGGLLRQPRGRTKTTWRARRETFHLIADMPHFHEQPEWQAVHFDVVEDTLREAFFVPKSKYCLINILAEGTLKWRKPLGVQAGPVAPASKYCSSDNRHDVD